MTGRKRGARYPGADRRVRHRGWPAGRRWRAPAPAGGTDRLDAVLRVRPPAARRARGAAARRAAAAAEAELRDEGKPDAGDRPAPGRPGRPDRRGLGAGDADRLDTGIGSDHVSFAGPGKTAAEIRQAVAGGVTIELESITEARRIVAAGEELGVRPRAAIRVNPDFAVKGSGMRMGGGPQQFGVDAEQVPGAARRLSSADIDITGFHIFAGSQNLRPRSSPRRSGRPSIWSSSWPSICPPRAATSTSAAGSASRTSTGTSRSTWRWWPTT